MIPRPIVSRLLLLSPLALVAALAFPAPPLAAQAAQQEWCRERDTGRNQHCEVRQITMRARDAALAIDVGPNGSVQVEGYSGTDVRVTARVTARARDERAAEALAREVVIDAREGELRARGPRNTGNTSWSVSVRVQVPSGTAITARTTNGAIDVASTHAAVNATTTNGSITLAQVGGAITARSTNGSIRAALSPATQAVGGIELRTTNGSVQLAVPERASANLDLATTNGRITTDVPVTIQGRVSNRQLTATLGSGGPEIRIRTTNGSIRIGRS
jgi:hypothetical protein